MDSIRAGTRVFVGRLSYDARERDIERFFKGYGRVREILLKHGYGFVEFDDARDADDAIYELNGRELLGERVVLEHARGPSSRRGGGGDGYRDNYGRGGGGGYGGRDGGRPRYSEKYGPPTRTDHRLIVENLSSRVSWQDLKDYMRQSGEVTYADAHKEQKNVGVIEFASHRDMMNAKDRLDGTEINGRKIKLIEDKPRGRGRSRSRSNSRGRRSYSRSRSRSPRRSRSRSRSRSASKSPSRSPRRSRSPSKSRSRSRSKSQD